MTATTARKLTQAQAREAARLANLIRRERDWITSHSRGAGLAGYVQRYGDSSSAPGKPPEGRYGEGGQAIYEADMAVLDRLQAEYQALTGHRY